MGTRALKAIDFWITFHVLGQVNLYSHYLRLPEKKDPRPKWTIYKHISYKNKPFLSVSSFRILSVVVVICSAPTAYTSLYRGLKYLL